MHIYKALAKTKSKRRKQSSDTELIAKQSKEIPTFSANMKLKIPRSRRSVTFSMHHHFYTT